jgi:NADH-quinone oxidoreductase subunit A
MTPLAAYLLLFVAVGVGFIFVHLVAGKLIRPSKPDMEKGTIYECGEPTIGSAWIQFDLRFYVVALLFVIFDVEVAFFFPWAEVFGKANAVANTPKPATAAEYRDYSAKVLDLALPITALSEQESKRLLRYRQLHTMTDEQLVTLKAEQARIAEKRQRKEKLTDDEDRLARLDGALPENDFRDNQEGARTLAWMAFGEVAVFFGVLLVGFAYLWRRGDLAWVRSTAAERTPTLGEVPPPSPSPEPVVSAARETVGVGGHS